MLETIIFGTYTVRDLLPYAIGVAALWIVWKLIKMIFGTEKTNEFMQMARCKSCGWQGQVGRYGGKCPKCAEPLGDRKGKIS